MFSSVDLIERTSPIALFSVDSSARISRVEAISGSESIAS